MAVEITKEEQIEVRESFAINYTDVTSAERIVDDAGIESGAIDYSGTPTNRWFKIFKEAKKQSKLYSLVLRYNINIYPDDLIQSTQNQIKRFIQKTPSFVGEILVVRDKNQEQAFLDNPLLTESISVVKRIYPDPEMFYKLLIKLDIRTPFNPTNSYQIELENFVKALNETLELPKLVFELFHDNKADDAVARLFNALIGKDEYYKQSVPIFNRLFKNQDYDNLLASLSILKRHTDSRRLFRLIELAEKAKSDSERNNQLEDIVELYFSNFEKTTYTKDINYTPNADVINFEKEIDRFLKITTAERTEKILICQGEKNAGKSTLLREFSRILEENDIPTLGFECERQTDLKKLLSAISSEIYDKKLLESPHLQDFDFWAFDRRNCLKFLEAIRDVGNDQSCFLILSNLDKAPTEFRVWFEEILVKNYSEDIPLTILVSCTEEMNYDKTDELIFYSKLKGFPEDTYIKYVRETKKIELSEKEEEEFRVQIKKYNGLPGQIAPIIDTIEYMTNGK